eukprot:CAMPEP_0176028132 /NCGR_PEP_ID=MMETSP0120_2-20121206/13804_1 /TAXON_ID=160619 /ORGANISM="Kryptoperidinium foliaceum, Strain CCMP 1326" /LENGTH=54 /DNA_ID=CAMNT_0017361341 /DNA_START=72 /DNA_END=236 /DNA_ORIENTATION=+
MKPNSMYSKPGQLGKSELRPIVKPFIAIMKPDTLSSTIKAVGGSSTSSGSGIFK